MPSSRSFMRGYARREVDDLFARIEATLGGGPVTGDPVTAAELRATQLSVTMRGYAPRQAGEALNAALQELERRRPAGRLPGPLSYRGGRQTLPTRTIGPNSAR